jgi:hypothetical protein
MRLDAETALLEAVRQRLMEAMGLESSAVEVELDDQAPAMTGDKYFVVSSNGASPGQFSKRGEKIVHDVFGVRVAAIKRIGNVPRDRRRDSVFSYNLDSVNTLLTQVSEALRLDYAVLNIANATLSLRGMTGKFMVPMNVQSVDPKPRTETGDIYDAKRQAQKGTPVAAIVRGINFAGAEYVGDR